MTKILNYSLIQKEYSILLMFFIVALIITVIILKLSYFLIAQNPESEKLSAYECGFEPYDDTRNTFDVRFCVIAILFMIFDIETMFLIPWSVSLANLDLLSFWSMIDFLFELGIGFFYAWYVRALDWN